jgi:hypothetical protein
MKSFIVLLLLSLTACYQNNSVEDNHELIIRDSYFQGKVVFQKLTSRKGFRLKLKNAAGETLDRTIFQYEPYQLDIGDVNGDGHTEVLVGLIKSTQFDPIEKKRLFILRIDGGQLRPLWLGSRVCQELVNFKAAKSGLVQTLEKNKKGNYALGLYAWQGFGLVLKKYTHNELSFTDAQKIFENAL